jgi:hypothetical protein
MIPFDFITEWRSQAPWVSDLQVEQDLILTRAVVDLFSHETLPGALAFRGGTALHKLFLAPAARYSEDLDLVQVKGGRSVRPSRRSDPCSILGWGPPSERPARAG